MLKKRTKVVILVAMVLLLGVTGYLNVTLNNSINATGAGTVSTANYFDTYRTDRQSSRDQALLYYDAIIASEASTEAQTAEASQKQLELVADMEQELVIEGLIKAKGFEDVVVTNSKSYMNIVVKSAELTSVQVSQIANIVYDNTNLTIDNIKIIPVE